MLFVTLECDDLAQASVVMAMALGHGFEVRPKVKLVITMPGGTPDTWAAAWKEILDRGPVHDALFNIALAEGVR